MRDKSQKRSLKNKIEDLIRRLFRKRQTPPEGDPYAYAMAPLRRGPTGRSGAAVAEIEDDDFHSFPPRR